MFVFRKRAHKPCARAALFPTSATSLAASLLIITLSLTACGIPAEPLPESKPLQSSIATPGVPTAPAITNTPITPVAVQIATIAASPTGPALPPPPTVAAPTAAAVVPTTPVQPTVKAARTVTVTLTSTVDPSAPPTPTVSNPSGLGTFLTSTSVVGTITALAATPTYPPTDVPRVRRKPVTVIGAAGDAVPPTTVPDKTGINVQNKSQRVFPKGPATLTVKTKPNVACELSNIRKNEQGKDVLEPISSGSAKTSGSDGVIAWIWSVDGDEPFGTMTLVIDCRSVGVKQVAMDVAK